MSSEHDVPDTDIRESNPSSAGPQGLQGDLGISSERTGPLGDSPADRGIEGTGSHGTAPHETDGVFETERGSIGDVPREHPQEPAEGEDPDADDAPEPERTSPEDPAEGADPDADRAAERAADPTDTGIDRTVGEVNPDPVRNKHEFDPARNPGH
jgi:hypothetical protein